VEKNIRRVKRICVCGREIPIRKIKKDTRQFSRQTENMRRAEAAKVAERTRSRRSIRVIETNQYIERLSLFSAIAQNSPIPILPFTQWHWSRREIRTFGETAKLPQAVLDRSRAIIAG